MCTCILGEGAATSETQQLTVVRTSELLGTCTL